MVKRRVTIKQVAREAGVSTQTVSRVLNNRPDVAPETRKRIQQVIERLGYHPSHIARSLIRGRSFTLGVVGYGLEYFGPSRTLSGIEQQANDMGYTLLLVIIRRPEEQNVKKILRDMISHHVEGIIWAVPEIASNREWTLKEVHKLTVPVVFLTMQPRSKQTIVAVDNRSGGQMATKHLLDQGCQYIGLITGPLDWWEARQRKLGWQIALKNRGISIDRRLIFEGDWSAISGERGLIQLLEKQKRIDGVFACNDQMALGVLKAARKMGRNVPGDLAVVGFDDIPEAAYFYPPLSTVRQDMVELGHCAVRELGHILEAGRQDHMIDEQRAVFLQPELIVRESSTLIKTSEEGVI